MRTMPLTLAIIEGGSLFLAISGSVFLWGRPLSLDWANVAVNIAQTLALSLSCVMSFYYNDLYNLRIVRNFGEFSWRLLRSLGVSFILLVTFYTVLPSTRLADSALLSSLLTLICLVLPIRGVLYAIMNGRTFAERALILGTGPLASKIAREIEASPRLRASIVGFVDIEDGGRDTPLPPALHSSYRIVRAEEPLEKALEEIRPDRIIVALAERRGRLPGRNLLKMSMAGIPVQDWTDVYESIARKLPIEGLMPSHLIFSKDFKKPKFQMALRRAFNITVSAVGLVLTAPLMAIIAFLIKVDSKGPVFFVQDRVGLGGRTFRLLKFRTMHSDPADPTESVWNREVDSRVTRIGKWLRKLRLDELPQFINILRGDMDLVGPRPEMASNVKTMVEEIPYYFLRHVIRPGITGWAQVKHGYSMSKEDVTEKMRYDLYYIKHMSLWFDLRILMDTVKIVLFGRGAR